MWPFDRSPRRRIARAREWVRHGEYLHAREELDRLDDQEAEELWRIATEAQIVRVLGEVAAEMNLGNTARAWEFGEIARGLGATRERIEEARRSLKPELPRRRHELPGHRRAR